MLEQILCRSVRQDRVLRPTGRRLIVVKRKMGILAISAMLALSASLEAPVPSAPFPADISLRSGRTIEGWVLERRLDGWLVEVSAGETLLPRRRILAATPGGEDFAEFHRKARRTDPRRLALWARERGLWEYARRSAEEVIVSSPDDAEIRALLGYEKLQGVWVPQHAAEEYRYHEVVKSESPLRPEVPARPRVVHHHHHHVRTVVRVAPTPPAQVHQPLFKVTRTVPTDRGIGPMRMPSAMVSPRVRY